jgi:CheY-like chemotaxis protein
MSSILVVEDDRSTRQLLAETLKAAGFAVALAKDGVEVLKRLAGRSRGSPGSSSLRSPDQVESASHAYPGSVVSRASSTGMPTVKWYRLWNACPCSPSTSCTGSS